MDSSATENSPTNALFYWRTTMGSSFRNIIAFYKEHICVLMFVKIYVFSRNQWAEGRVQQRHRVMHCWLWSLLIYTVMMLALSFTYIHGHSFGYCAFLKFIKCLLYTIYRSNYLSVCFSLHTNWIQTWHSMSCSNTLWDAGIRQILSYLIQQKTSRNPSWQGYQCWVIMTSFWV